MVQLDVGGSGGVCMWVQGGSGYDGCWYSDAGGLPQLTVADRRTAGLNMAAVSTVATIVQVPRPGPRALTTSA